MDFAKILDEWENNSRKGSGKKKNDSSPAFKQWIDSDKFWDSYDKGEEYVETDKVQLRNRLRNMKAQADIDLHGLTADEALRALDRFLHESSRQGLRKVLIIHGKGNHSKESPVLPNTVLNYLRSSSLAGETGTADRKDGGSGATWVIIK